MTPDAAFQEQIARYRKMTGEQRLGIALDMHENECNLARESFRRQHPDADAAKIEQLLHDWIRSKREIKPCVIALERAQKG